MFPSSSHSPISSPILKSAGIIGDGTGTGLSTGAGNNSNGSKRSNPTPLDLNPTALTEFPSKFGLSPKSSTGLMDRLFLSSDSADPLQLFDFETGGVNSINKLSNVNQNKPPIRPPSQPQSHPSSSAGVVASSLSSDSVSFPLTFTPSNDSILLSRQYWMSDINCKVCDDCNSPFTFMVRRHHCRRCGRVFCHACSSKTISGKNFGVSGNLRVCNKCFELSQSEVRAFQIQANRLAQQQAQLANQAKMELQSKKEAELKARASKEKPKSKPNHNNGNSSNNKSADGSSFAFSLPGKGLSGLTDPNDDDAAGISQLNKSKVRKSLPSIDGFESDEIDENEEIKADEEEIDDAKNEEAKAASDEESGEELDDFEVAGQLDSKTVKPTDNSRFHSKGDHSTLTIPAAVPIFDSDELKHYSAHRLRLHRLSDIHLHQVVTLLLSSHQLPFYWINIILALARRVINSVKPDTRIGDKLDIREYTKIKTVGGGSPADCRFVDGVVFTKNIAHKKMRIRIKNPRILLLSCALEYQRDENRLASLDTLLAQEREYIGIQVSKILTLKPDLVIVEKSVSRLAQDLLRAAGISIALNVKPANMKRIARCTGTAILPATDYIDRNTLLGTCGKFSVKSFENTDSNSDSCTETGGEQLSEEKGENSNSETVDEKPFDFVDIGDPDYWARRLALHSTSDSAPSNRTQLMFFSDCPNKNHCSIYLRGADQPTLKIVKFILKQSVAVAYSLSLETALLYDSCASYKDDDLELQLAVYSRMKNSFVQNNQYSNDPASPIKPRQQNSLAAAKTDSASESNYLDSQSSNSPNSNSNSNSNSGSARPVLSGIPISSSPFIDLSAIPIPPVALRWLESSRQLFHPNSPTLTDSPFTWLHEGVLFCSTWLAGGTQCFPAELKSIEYYSESDKTLGQFLVENCFDVKLRCLNEKCRRDVLRHLLAYSHEKGRLVIGVKRIKRRPENPAANNKKSKVHFHPLDNPGTLLMWARCKICSRRVTPYTPMQESTFHFSFGKYLDLAFHNRRAVGRTGGCTHSIFGDQIRFFGLNGMMASFEYFPVEPFQVLIRPQLAIDPAMSIQHAIEELGKFSAVAYAVYQCFIHQTAEFDTKLDSPDHRTHLRSITQRICDERDHFTRYMEMESAEADNDRFSMFDLYRLQRRLVINFAHWNRAIAELGAIVFPTQKSSSIQQQVRNWWLSNQKENTQNANTAANAIDFKVTNRRASLIDEAAVPHSFLEIEKLDPPMEQNPLNEIKRENLTAAISQAAETEEREKEIKESVSAPILIHQNSDNRHEYDRSHSNNSIQFNPCVTVDNLTSVVSEVSIDFLTRPAHLHLPTLAFNLTIPVFEDEPSSIIAYSLASLDHLKLIGRIRPEEFPIHQEEAKRRQTEEENEIAKANADGERRISQINMKNIGNEETTQNSNERNSFGENSHSHNDQNPSESTPNNIPPSDLPLSQSKSDIKSDSRRSSLVHHSDSHRPPPLHLTHSAIVSSSDSNPFPAIDYLFSLDSTRDSDSTVDSDILNDSDTEAFKFKFEDSSKGISLGQEKTSFICTSFFPKQFHALRLWACGGDFNFIESLSRCSKWGATGGKSGSTFSKSHDDRLVLKYVSRNEVKMFLQIASRYFHYMSKSMFHGLPSLLVKILGVYQLSWKKSKGGEKMSSQYVFVMPNLFLDKLGMSKIFDLKGSARNRYVKRTAKEEKNRTLLDENLLEFTAGFPIPLVEKSKHFMRLAVFNDTLFLSSLSVVDYSILVGIDESKRHLIVGIIDFIRQYTWDKRLETGVKSVGMIAGQSLPTVISPNNYKLRFRAAMDRYFMVAPAIDSKLASQINAKEKTKNDGTRGRLGSPWKDQNRHLELDEAKKIEEIEAKKANENQVQVQTPISPTSSAMDEATPTPKPQQNQPSNENNTEQNQSITIHSSLSSAQTASNAAAAAGAATVAPAPMKSEKKSRSFFSFFF